MQGFFSVGGMQRFAAKLRSMCATTPGSAVRVQRRLGHADAHPADGSEIATAQRARSRLAGGALRVPSPPSEGAAAASSQHSDTSGQGSSGSALQSRGRTLSSHALPELLTPCAAASAHQSQIRRLSGSGAAALSPGSSSADGRSLDELFSAIEGLHDSALHPVQGSSGGTGSSRLSRADSAVVLSGGAHSGDECNENHLLASTVSIRLPMPLIN